MECVGEVPLLAGAIKIALMEKITQPFFESGCGCSAYEGVNECGAQVSVLFKELKYLEIARGEFDSLSCPRSTHP